MFTQINFEKFFIDNSDLKFLIIIASVVVFSSFSFNRISDSILEKIYNPKPVYSNYEVFDKIKTVYEMQSKINKVEINSDVYKFLIIENKKTEKDDIKNLPSLESLLSKNNIANRLPELKAIFIDSFTKFAILDDVTVKEKDTYKNFKVIKIEQDKILLEDINQGERVWLNLFK